MNPRINQLVKSLLQKDTLDQCTLPELEQFADRHPYFGAAQLLLTKKMQTESPERYEEQLQKTFLFFHNPLWVEHLLNDNGNAEITKTKKEMPAVEPSVHVPSEQIEKKEEVLPETTSPVTSIIEAASEGTGSPGTAPAPAAETPAFSTSASISVQQQDIPVAEMGAASTTKPDSAQKEELLFEPYHTVDYFASQGIRVREEEKPADKFGQQLKSFTEWLKTMKRLPVSEIAAQTEPAAEKKVEEMAERSLQDREILTEAMAEVWEKQGNREKAIEVYSKLSLLEPSKSAYFAAKIEVLKK